MIPKINLSSHDDTTEIALKQDKKPGKIFEMEQQIINYPRLIILILLLLLKTRTDSMVKYDNWSREH